MNSNFSRILRHSFQSIKAVRTFTARNYFGFPDLFNMRIERDGSNGTITFCPDEGRHSATVVLMHGLGDSAEGLSDLAERWGSSLGHIKFILPTAEQRPVTLNGGMAMTAWYDIVGLDDRASESCEGIDASVARIRSILGAENSAGMPYSRMLLAGFSQGGAMSIFTGLQLPEPDQKLAGLMVMSGYLPGQSQFKLTPGFETIPVLHCHGSSDPVVRPEWAKMTEDGLKSKGMTDYSLKMYSDVGHSISMAILDDAQAHIAKCLPHDSAFVQKPKPPCEMSVKELKQAVRRNGLGQQAVGFTEKHEFVKLLEDHIASQP